jgi:5,10-methylenetetrahydromethanopterin reductase
MSRQISIAFQTDKNPAQYIALAKYIDHYDFDTVSVYCDAPFHPSYGPLLLMAPHISRARIGPAAVNPSRITPIDIAAETALLEQLAPGRVYLGLSRGSWLAEHGIAEAQPPLQAIRETVDIVRYMLSGRTGGYEGQVFNLSPHVISPYPLPKDPVPLLIGTWGPKLAILAGEIADEVKVGGTTNPAVLPLIKDYIAQGERNAGRAPGSVGLVVGAVTVVDEDREQARQIARRSATLYLPIVAALDPTIDLEPGLIERLREHASRHEFTDAAALISDDLLDRFAFSGNAADVIQQAEALFDAGATRIEFGTPHGLTAESGIQTLGKVVIPGLR